MGCEAGVMASVWGIHHTGGTRVGMVPTVNEGRIPPEVFLYLGQVTYFSHAPHQSVCVRHRKTSGLELSSLKV